MTRNVTHLCAFLMTCLAVLSDVAHGSPATGNRVFPPTEDVPNLKGKAKDWEGALRVKAEGSLSEGSRPRGRNGQGFRRLTTGSAASVNWVFPPMKVPNLPRVKVKAGGFVTFKWGDALPHDLQQFRDGKAFQGCSFSGAKLVVGLGARLPSKRVQMKKKGSYFYGCQVRGHCERGQKVKVIVT